MKCWFRTTCVIVSLIMLKTEAVTPMKQAQNLTSNNADIRRELVILKNDEVILNKELLNWTFITNEYEKYLRQNSKSFLGTSESNMKNILMDAYAISKYYLPVNFKSKVSECKRTIQTMVSKNFQFTLNLVDSWGKLPDGILWGNYKPVGMYEQCLNLSTNDLSIKGRYCFLQVSVNNSGLIQQPLDLQTGFILGTIPVSDMLYSYGTCIPDNCTKDDMEFSLQKVFEDAHKGRTLNKITCYSVSDAIKLTAGDISMIFFLCIIVALLIISTVADIYTEKSNSSIKNGYLRFVLPFSPYTNVRKLFNVNISPPKSSITCLHGMRVLSMIWVVYGHQYIFTLTETSNLLDVGRKTRSLGFQAFANGTFSVDSFFFFSGLLVTYLTLQVMSNNNGHINLLMFYVHRYLRLTPAIAFTAWFQATLARFLVDGPYASRFDFIVENCRNNWWTDILYVNNYATNSQVEGKGDCVGQAWYTAVDTQIFIFTPIFFIPLFRYRIWGKIWLVFWTLASCLIPAIITVCLNFPPFDKMHSDPERKLLYWRVMYAAPFSRAGPYFVGIWAGYFIYKMRDTRLHLKYWQVALGWAASTSISLSILFGMWDYNVLGYRADTSWNKATQFFYGGFSRAAWAVPLSWIVIMCHKGYGGPVNWFLSHPIFQPLSRLTYAMFLTSLGMQFVVMYSNKQLFYFNHLNKLIETCGILFIIAVASTILTLLIESPMITLEKEIFKKNNKNSEKGNLYTKK